MPNDYDELALWDEVFAWRSHMFNAITSNFSWSEPSTLATLHDRPWTAIRMSMAARKQGLREVKPTIFVDVSVLDTFSHFLLDIVIVAQQAH